MVLSTWLHTKLFYVGLNNVFAFPNLQTPWSFPKLYLLHFKNLYWCLFNVNFCHNFTKFTTHIWPWIDFKFGESWKAMFITIFQNFSSFKLKKWEIFLLLWNHLKLGPEHKMTYNSLSATPNSLRFWETHKIYVFYIYAEF